MILIGHTDIPRYIVYSLNGDTLVSGGNDRRVRLWDVSSGRCRASVHYSIDDFRRITRGIFSEDIYVNMLSSDAAAPVYKLFDEVDRCRLVSCWIDITGALTVTGASIQGVRGLSQLNKQLLKQRGAEGEPELQLLQSSKKVIAMASVLSRLRYPTDRTTVNIPLNDGVLGKHEPQSVQERD
jgi:WD40 repeat protein